MNLVSSFFQCFNSGLSVSRTIVYEKTGAKSQVGYVLITTSYSAKQRKYFVQLAALVGVGIVIITILFISPYLALLPQVIFYLVVYCRILYLPFVNSFQGILASIIIVACVDLLRQLKELKYLWHVSKIDFVKVIVSTVSTVIITVNCFRLFT